MKQRTVKSLLALVLACTSLVSALVAEEAVTLVEGETIETLVSANPDAAGTDDAQNANDDEAVSDGDAAADGLDDEDGAADGAAVAEGEEAADADAQDNGATEGSDEEQASEAPAEGTETVAEETEQVEETKPAEETAPVEEAQAAPYVHEQLISVASTEVSTVAAAEVEEAECDHVWEEDGDWYDHQNPRYEQIEGNDSNHTIIYENLVHYVQYYCSKCESYKQESEQTTQTESWGEPHAYNGGDTCSKCGYALKECEHEWDSNGYCMKCGIVCGHDWSNKDGVCAICGYKHEYHDWWSGDESTGVCYVCGYACKHGEINTRFESLGVKGTAKEIAGNDAVHTATIQYANVTSCDECGMTIKTEILDQEDGERWHSYDDDGVCMDCGHVCAHSERYVTDEYWLDDETIDGVKYDVTYTDNGDGTHTVKGYQGWHYHCEYCDYCFGSENDEIVGPIEEVARHYQSRWDEETDTYSCACGYVFKKSEDCDHKNAEYILDIEGDWVEEIKGDDEYHAHKQEQWEYDRCSDCGEYLNEKSSTTTVKEAHDYTANGVCRECGHARINAPHTHTPAEAVKENVVAASCAAEGSYDEVVYCKECEAELSREKKTVAKLAHTPAEAVKENEVAATCTAEGSYDEVVYCSVCKAELSREKKTVAMIDHTPAKAVKENVVKATYETEGSYDKVVYCEVCGAELSREAKTIPVLTEPEEGPQMELVFEEVDENTEINGIVVADHPAMAEALATVGESLDVENVTVEIVDSEKLMNVEEKAKFDRLPVKDRLLVVLSALGFGDALGDTADEMTDDAKALAESIAARVDSLSEAEKDALLNSIAGKFEPRLVVVDGVEYESVGIEVVIDRDGKKTYERYIFYKADGTWKLYNIEVGEYRIVED
ncbi:MAG: hypothetical protein IJ769_11875 [Clostridia bacterium]|nr:hypothetical protein [Clostridia bacterium]